MPFNSKSGTDAVRQRWGDRTEDDIRNRQFKVTISANELERIQEKVEITGLSRADLVVKAIDRFDPMQRD